jgi:hypothetical protein
MTPRFAAIVIVGLLLDSFAGAQDAAKPPVDIKTDTTWTGEVAVDSAVRVTRGTLPRYSTFTATPTPPSPAPLPSTLAT